MAKIEEIEHLHLPIRGLNLHIAQAGTGESGVVVFLHGFPEIWYSWRHQVLAAAAAGYRAVAFDWRGYGLSDQPPQEEVEQASWDDLVGDLLAILDALSITKAFFVAKDFGAWPAYHFALKHPDRTHGVVSLGIPFGLWSSSESSFQHALPEGFYINRWRESGRAESDFGRFDVKTVVRTIYILFSRSNIPIAGEKQEIMDLADSSTPLPEWFSEKDLDVYAALYQKSGFRYPLQMPYRAIHKLESESDAKIQVPVLLIMGEEDYVYKFPNVEACLKGKIMESLVPDLAITYIPQGSHFVQEQFPHRVNQLMLGFFNDHTPSA